MENSKGLEKQNTNQSMVMEKQTPYSQYLMTSVFDAIVEGVVVFDRFGIIRDMNESLLKIHGYSNKEDVIGRDALELVVPTDRALVRREMKYTSDFAIDNFIECTLIKKDGTTFSAELKTRSLTNDSGQQIGLVSVVTDVTERRLNEEDIIIAESNFRRSLDESPLGVIIMDRDKQPVYANHGLLDIFGFSSMEDMANTSPAEFMTTQSYADHLDRQSKIENGQPQPNTYEISIVTKDFGIRHLMVFRRGVIWKGEVCAQYSYYDITQRRESEELYEILAANSPVGVYIMQNAKLVYANSKFLKLSGYSLDELQAMDNEQFVHPDDLAHVKVSARKMLNDETAPSYEFRYIDAHGNVRWAIESVSLINYHGKKAIVGNLTDITEKKKIEDILAYSDAALKSIHEGIYAMDNDFVIIRWNSICEQMFGIDRSDAVGKHIWEIMELVEDYPLHNTERIKKLFKDGANHEEQRYRVNGKELWIDVHAQAIVSDGKKVGWITILSDITERKNIERELKESEEYMRSLISSMDDVVFTYDLDGYFGRFYKASNDVTAHLETMDLTFIGKHYRETLPSDVADKLDSAFVELKKTGETQQFDYSIDILTTEKWYDARVSPIRDASGKMISVLAISRDISERKLAEKALVESEERIRSLINSMDDIVFTYDLDGVFSPFFKAPEGIQEYMENTDYTFVGKSYRDVLDKDIADKLDQAIAALLETDENQQFEYSMPINDRDRWYDARVSAIKNNENQAASILVVSRDISDRKRTEKALVESEERIRSLINSMDDLMFSYTLDGRFDRFYKITNYPETEPDSRNFLGTTYHDFLPEHVATKMDLAFDAVKTTGENQQFDYAMPVEGEERWFDARVSPVLDNLRQISGILVVSREISERKKMEDLIAEAAREWEATFDSLTEQIYIIDKDYRIIKANKAYANTIGVDSEDITGTRCYKLVHNRNTPCPWCSVNDVLRTKTKVIRDIPPINGDKYHQAVTSPIFDDDGMVTSYITSIRDVSEVKRIESQLQQSQLLASLGTMTAGIAHEVNNPLGSVLLLSELLLKESESETIRKDLRVIHGEAKRAAKIMSTLLTYRKRSVTNNRRLNLNRIIEKVLSIRKYRLNVLNIKTNVNLPQEPVYIRGDFSQLTQVFINILINAEEALRDRTNGMISLDIFYDKNWVTIEISDNGCGLDPEIIENIFHPFFTTKNVGEGSGLGLSTCYSIVTAHEGLINARNNDQGGATIVVELPLISKKKRSNQGSETIRVKNTQESK